MSVGRDGYARRVQDLNSFVDELSDNAPCGLCIGKGGFGGRHIVYYYPALDTKDVDMLSFTTCLRAPTLESTLGPWAKGTTTERDRDCNTLSPLLMEEVPSRSTNGMKAFSNLLAHVMSQGNSEETWRRVRGEGARVGQGPGGADAPSCLLIVRFPR